MRGYSGSELIVNGDSVKILASKMELTTNATSVPCYELIKNDTLIFSLHQYNSTLLDELRLPKIFLWIAFGFLTLYILVDRTGLIKWVENQLSSEDKNFQPNKPNFNEFLDQ